MASSIAGSSISLKPLPQAALLKSSLVTNNYGQNSSVSFLRTSSPKFQPVHLRSRISCAAKPETIEKVCGIVKKQLATKEPVTAETTFSELGADSLDTVEIVMKLEEEFEVTVEEEKAQSIKTIACAAELIEELQKK